MFSSILNGYFNSAFKLLPNIKRCVHNIELYFDELMCSRLINTELSEDRFRTTQSMVMFTASPITKFHTLCFHGISSSNEGQNISLLYHKTGKYWTVFTQSRLYLHQLSLNQLVDVHGNSYECHVK
jgi:hypothetical protein